MTDPELVYTTKFGRAFRGDSRSLLASRRVVPGSVDLIFTSPPFALTREKDYGNKSAHEYLDWFRSFVPHFKRVLSDSGSLVIDLGGAYLPGAPRRSIYHFEMAVMLSEYFELCQEFYWYNPAKLPAPAEWVNVRRLRVKDSVNLLLWFAKDASNTKASNKRVLRRYSDSMNALLKNGYQIRKRPSNHDISKKFLTDRGGAIPSNLLGFTEPQSPLVQLEGAIFEEAFDNLLTIANTQSRDRYLTRCREQGIKPHSARFPLGLPAFFVEFLTEPGDLVCDPFAGSNTTGEAAELLRRRWVSSDLDEEGKSNGTYVRSSAFRFDSPKFEQAFERTPTGNWASAASRATPTQEVTKSSKAVAKTKAAAKK